MSNAKRPAKTANKTKAATKTPKKKTTPTAHPLEMVPAAAPARAPEVSVQDYSPGPIAVPDVRQEGRYVYGIIQTREPLTFGRMGIGGRGEMVYLVTNGDIA